MASKGADLSQAGLPPPFANPLLCSLDFWQGKLGLWSAVPAVGYSPALGPSSGSPAVGSCSLLRATGLPPAGTPRRTGPGAVVTGILTGSQPAFALQKPRLDGLELELWWCQQRGDSWVPPSPAWGRSGSLGLACSFTHLRQSFAAGLKV